jgi:hypothetical protein
MSNHTWSICPLILFFTGLVLSQTYSLEDSLTYSDQREAFSFGSSVAISSDGSHMIVGLPFSKSSGMVIVYTRGSRGWQELTEILYPGPFSGDQVQFGNSVGISANGTMLVVGCQAYTQVSPQGQGSCFFTVSSYQVL